MKKNTANFYNKAKKTSLFSICTLLTLWLVIFSGSASAGDLSEQRAQAKNEVGPLFFNKFISLDANLTDSSGPERWQKLFGKPFIGCPTLPLASSETLSLEFTTSGAQAWAGSLDGINLGISTISGFPGGALALPSNSTARESSSSSRPALSFFFDQTSNVTRAAIDNAAREIDKCLSKLPPGNYPGDEFSKLCPYPEIPASQFKQTCVVNTYGEIGEPIENGSGYRVVVHEQKMCDGVGYGRPQPNNPGWVSCYQNTYEGFAKITSGRGGTRISNFRAASKIALRKCGSSRVRANSRKTGICAAKSMVRSLARRSRS
jgi:hypothetical protein